MTKKMISVTIPCYREENSIKEMYERLQRVFLEIPQYDYEIIFVDDCSPDNTWKEILQICALDNKVKGIHNIKNFGPIRNIFQTIRYGTGDVVFVLMGDLQQPPENLLEFIKYWEEGYTAVVGVHTNTKDTGIKSFFRNVYYKLIDEMSNKKIIPHFSYFGLYDRTFINLLNSIDDIQPFLPGILSEYCSKIKVIEIRQEDSKRGRSEQSFLRKYDQAMIAITSYTKLLMRLATFIGICIGIIAIVFSVFVFILKLLFWNSYPLGIPTITIGIFFLGAIQLFFLGILGEYILSINDRSMKRPITLIDKKINFNK